MKLSPVHLHPHYIRVTYNKYINSYTDLLSDNISSISEQHIYIPINNILVNPKFNTTLTSIYNITNLLYKS